MDKLNKYQEFCNYLKEEYINKLSGESKDDEYIIGETIRQNCYWPFGFWRFRR